MIWFKKKIILLDIDGVLSPLGAIDGLVTKINMDWAYLSIPDSLLSLLIKISKHDVRWISTWGDLSNKINKKIEINVFPIVDIENNKSILWLKDVELIKFCKRNKRKDILIIDDEVHPDSELFNLRNVTIVKPNYLTGINTKEEADIRKWIKK